MTYGGRPAETGSALVAGCVFAVLTIASSYGANIPKPVWGAANILVGGVAAVVTWWVNRRAKKDGNKFLAANPGGTTLTIEPSPPDV